MGKHKKSKKHRHKKKSKSRRSSSSSSSSSNEEWVEKESQTATKEEKPQQKPPAQERDEWMSLTSLFTTSELQDRRKERELAKQKEREASIYNPGKSTRELNPYWKDGGDGLPSLTQKSKFIKPNEESSYQSSYKSKSSRPNWRKKSPPRRQEPEPSSSRYSPPRREAYSPPRREPYSPPRREPETKHKIEEQSSSDFLTDKEMNDIGAKIVKAEILGQTAKVKELKEKLERAREHRKNHPEEENQEEGVILYRTDSRGYSKPLNAPEPDNYKRKKKAETHDAGKRQKYFPDDDKYSLKQMFENEKFSSAQQDAEFVKLASKVSKNDDMDDVFVDKIRNEKTTEKNAQKEKDRAVAEHHRMNDALDNCRQCVQSSRMEKHLMITLGETVYLSLPPYEPLTEGHCLLIPTRHVSCSTQLDENEWAEINTFRKSLTNMFLSDDNDVIFFETVLNAHSYNHMIINCVPVPKEQGDMAPIYFKKAIDECETEWSTNKKLVSLSGRDVRRAIPKGLPYFFVSFGMTEGFAHVIEDQRYFPKNFAAEIIGGILDLHHSKWRNPRQEKFDQQKSRVLQFSQQWTKFDCTKMCK